MTDSFPRQAARTMNFALGVPRSFRLSPDGQTVIFLRSKAGSDPVNCLWALDVAAGQERLIADPAEIGKVGAEDDAVEKARRERVREDARGIVAFATDRYASMATFALAGTVYLAELGAGGGVRELRTRTPAADPRPDPTGKFVAYVSAGALRVHDLATGADRALADPEGAEGISFGLAEFIAAEEMGRTRGYWWAPDGSAILTARVDETPVRFWHIADPANPERPGRAVRYPAAGTPNAVVTVYVARLDGELTEVRWDAAALPYLVTAAWDSPAAATETAGGSTVTAGATASAGSTAAAGATATAGGTATAGSTASAGSTATAGGAETEAARPLIVVASRDQRDMRILAVDPATGATSLVRSDSDPSWIDIVPGVPATAADGRVVWTADADGAKRLVAGTAAEHAAGTAEFLTPDSMNVRGVLGIDGDTVLFSASTEDPASTSVWTAGPAGLTQVSPPDGVHQGHLAGGSLLLISQTLANTETSVRVQRTGPDGARADVARIGSLAETPSLPVPKPQLTWSAGPSRTRTAILLPSWHKTGSGKLPVLCDPYGGPHHAKVTAAIGAEYLSSQWFAEQGFAVVIADGRGTPGRGPEWDRAVTGDLAGPVLADQVEALQSAASECPDLDLTRVGIRGWSFGGYLAALAVLRRPDVFHAAIAGAPPTDWRLYDTCYTERYLGLPDESPEVYARSSLLAEAAKLSRPLLLIHGMVDDNVVVAHSLRLSSALLAAGRPHSVLPLSGVTHRAKQEDVAENLLLLQVDFLRSALGIQVLSGQRT